MKAYCRIPKKREKWKKLKSFEEKYGIPAMTYDERWKIMYNTALEYMTEYKKRPSDDSRDPHEKRCGQWLSAQIHNYKDVFAVSSQLR